MSVTVRPYRHADDFEPVGRFLIGAYRPGDRLGVWLQPRWEYMHHHPFILGQPIDRFGVAEEAGTILGIVHFEDHPAVTYLQAAPGRDDVTVPLVRHALAHLGGSSPAYGERVLTMWVPEFDSTLAAVLTDHGFSPVDGVDEPHSRLDLGTLGDPAPPRPGFRLQSLAEENDLTRINEVLWRGFNHEGPPPESELPGRRFAQSAPNYRRDLTIVAVAPDGRYASFAGMWVVPENRVAYVEPVATDPDFRRMGLGTAAVTETLHRAAAAGAEVAWVGSDQEFYAAMGFTVAFRSRLWLTHLG